MHEVELIRLEREITLNRNGEKYDIMKQIF